MAEQSIVATSGTGGGSGADTLNALKSGGFYVNVLGMLGGYLVIATLANIFSAGSTTVDRLS